MKTLNELQLENIQLSIARIITSSDTRMVFKESTDSSIHVLDCISENLGYDLTECANLAWNEIKNRKGKTINGSFIKD